MNVAIAANHNIDMTRDMASKIAALMAVLADENGKEIATWGEPNRVAVRAPSTAGMTSPVERFVIHLAADLGLDCLWYRPAPNEGRAGVFRRDYQMVEASQRVVAFFREDRIMEGGTGHVVQAALVRGVPVEAWTFTDDGILSIGSDDGLEVGAEGSAWMQRRFLEWQEREAQRQIQDSLLWGPVVNTATPIKTNIYTSDSTDPNLVLGPGKVWVNGSWVGNGTISVSSTPSLPPSWGLSPNQSYTARRSG